jgi:hypothetical protein
MSGKPTYAGIAVTLVAFAAMLVLAGASARATDAGTPAAPPAPGASGGPWGPWSDQPGRWDAARDAVVASAGAPPDRRTRRLDARRLFAERRARDFAIARLHRFADDAMAMNQSLPRAATAVHRAIDRRAQVASIRRRADGSAIVEMLVAGVALRRASGERGPLPWQRSSP